MASTATSRPGWGKRGLLGLVVVVEAKLAGTAGDAVRRLAVIRVVARDSRVRQRHRSARVEDASTVSGRVTGHLAVLQRDGSADQRHRAREGHAVGDTAPVAAGSVVVHAAVI